MYKPDNVCNAAACRSQADDLAPVFTGSAQRINYIFLLPQYIVVVKGCILSKTQRERRIFAHVDMKEEQSLPAMWPTIYRLRHRANELRLITWQTDCLSRCYEKAGRAGVFYKHRTWKKNFRPRCKVGCEIRKSMIGFSRTAIARNF